MEPRQQHPHALSSSGKTDVLWLIFFSAVTPYVYLWLMGYLVAYSPIQRIYHLFSAPSHSMVVVSLSIATILHSLLLAIPLVGPFGFLISGKKTGLLLIFLVAALIQILLYSPSPWPVSNVELVSYLAFVVSMTAAFYLGCRLRKFMTKT